MPHNGLPHTEEIDPALVIPAAPALPEGIPLVETPGSRRFKERQKALGQMSTGENIAAGFSAFTAVAPLLRMVADEGAMGVLPNIFGWKEQFRDGMTPLNQKEAEKALDPRIDRDLAMSLLQEQTLEGFTLRHQRAIDELDVLDRIDVQYAGAGITHLAAAMLDLDIIAGGFASKAFMAARIAGKTQRMAARAGLKFKVSERVTSTALGLNVGLQGGALTGLTEFGTRETVGWQDLASILIASTALTGVAGGVLNGSKNLHAQIAEKEFLDRVRANDPNLTQPPSAGRMDPGNAIPDTATVIGGEAPRGVGAEATGAGGRPRRVLDDPQGPIGREEEDIINFADEKLHESGFHDKKEQAAGSLWTKLALSKIGGFSVENFNKLYSSKSAVLNYMSSFIFESPSGLGRGNTTASVMQDIYHRSVMETIGLRELGPLVNKWAEKNGHTWQGSGLGISARGRKAFDRELMLERNERAMGRKSNPSDEIKEAADRFDAAAERGLHIAVGEEGEMAIDGMVSGMKRPGYNPYRHDGAEIESLIAQGVKRSDIEAAYEQAYRSAGMTQGKDAAAVAKAVVMRALKREQRLDGSMQTLMSGDGREFMRESLTDSGLSKADIDTIMQRLIGSVEDRAKEGFAKTRNELDMNIKIKNNLGLDLRLVDVMEKDMDRTWQRYARQVSGAASLARIGVTNRAKRTTFIKAAQAEQRALGEEVMDADLLEAMFSHFNAGPTHGFFDGVTNEGVGIVIATAKRIANLGLLEKLGITQLGEFGAVMAQVGLRNWYRRGPMVLFDKQLREAGSKLLDEVSYITGPLGRDEQFYAEWFDLDDVGSSHKADWLAKASKISSNLAFVQGYVSAFNHVRKYQQKIAVLGMVDKIMRGVRGGDLDAMLKRFESDLGMGLDELGEIENMVLSGLIEFDAKGGFVTKLNLDKWEPVLRRNFGAALVRNMHQTVQKSLAGEQDAWMHTGWGSLMTHLMTFPMQAFQKQFIRNGRMMDLQAGAAMGFGLTSAMVAVNIRDVIDGRDRSQSERAVQAFTYNNMTGWVPMVTDPVFTILGLDDQRINAFGAFNSIVPPVFGQADNLRRVPGAIIHAAQGENDYFDQQALKALPFAGVYFANRLWSGLAAGADKAETDDEFLAGFKPQNVTDPNETGPPTPTAAPTAAENFANRESLKDFLDK